MKKEMPHEIILDVGHNGLNIFIWLRDKTYFISLKIYLFSKSLINIF